MWSASSKSSVPAWRRRTANAAFNAQCSANDGSRDCPRSCSAGRRIDYNTATLFHLKERHVLSGSGSPNAIEAARDESAGSLSRRHLFSCGSGLIVARASRPCVACTIRTGETPVPLQKHCIVSGSPQTFGALSCPAARWCARRLSPRLHHSRLRRRTRWRNDAGR